MNNEDGKHETATLPENELNGGRWARMIVEQSTAVEAGAELSVTSSTNLSGNASSNVCLTTKPDSTYGTCNSSEPDDTITDEDIALFLEDKPYTTNSIPESCTHLYCVQPVPESGIDVKAPCAVCNSTDENWICLTCYQVYCSRYVNKHMVAHTQESNHVMTLSLRDVSVWCYRCDDYVYNEVLEEPIRIVLDAKYGSPTDVITMAAAVPTSD